MRVNEHGEVEGDMNMVRVNEHEMTKSPCSAEDAVRRHTFGLPL